ncbi:MAG TPA: hypothetical protein VN754_03865 [Candidatus Binataceae bacterium]|nr:hypothetical protein [Candidatus Binataceae bacterium]
MRRKHIDIERHRAALRAVHAVFTRQLRKSGGFAIEDLFAAVDTYGEQSGAFGSEDDEEFEDKVYPWIDPSSAPGMESSKRRANGSTWPMLSIG